MSVEIMLGAEFGVAFVAVVRLLHVVHPQDVDVQIRQLEQVHYS